MYKQNKLMTLNISFDVDEKKLKLNSEEDII